MIDAALMLEVIAGPDPRDRWSLPDEGVGWIRRRIVAGPLAPEDRLLSGLGRNSASIDGCATIVDRAVQALRNGFGLVR